MRKCVIIMNPESGKVKKLNGFKEFYDISRKYDYDTKIIFTKAKKDATEIVKNLPDDIDLVISAGGDGTLNEVVTGNSERDKKLIISNLPMGTTNDVASMYGYTSNVLKNLEILLSGKKKSIDVCYINNKPFVYVACLGDYIDAAYNTPRNLKKKYGRLAYIIYGIKEFSKKINTYNIRYKIDGEEYTGRYSFIFITNSSRIGGVNDIYYDVKLDDNMFEVAFADIKNKKDMLKTLFLLSNIEIKDVPGIKYYQTNNLEIEFLNGPETSWCIDGEELDDKSSTYTFKINKNMKMMVPEEKVGELFE